MKKAKFDKPELSVEELSRALYEANLKLQEANNKLKDEERRKNDFYANISHDLRAPITAISNSVQYMLSTDSLSTDELNSTLSLMQKRVDYLERLINDIFLLSSLDSSAQKVHKEPVDISFFIEDFFYMCEADSRFEGVDMQLDLDENMDATIMIDPHLMQRVFENLFTNAVKYSKEKPAITLRAEQKKDTIIISVIDNGIGISSENLPHIFDRSFQVQQARTPDEHSGSGFGLSIVKSIIEHHQGNITCESTLGEESCFTITLPLH